MFLKKKSNISKRRIKVSSVNTKIVRHYHWRPSPVLSFPYRCPPYWPQHSFTIETHLVHLPSVLVLSPPFTTAWFTFVVVILSIPSNKTPSY
jgi:hypothetical protein